MAPISNTFSTTPMTSSSRSGRPGRWRPAVLRARTRCKTAVKPARSLVVHAWETACRVVPPLLRHLAMELTGCRLWGAVLPPPVRRLLPAGVARVRRVVARRFRLLQVLQTRSSCPAGRVGCSEGGGHECSELAVARAGCRGKTERQLSLRSCCAHSEMTRWVVGDTQSRIRSCSTPAAAAPGRQLQVIPTCMTQPGIAVRHLLNVEVRCMLYNTAGNREHFDSARPGALPRQHARIRRECSV